MIRYAKGAQPVRLTALAATPGIDWNALGATDKDPIREAVVRDQGGLCAYCQRRITVDEDPASGQTRMKIEHWHARSDDDARQLIWNNLLGVCTGVSQDDRGHRVQHCDTSRGAKKLFLHPVDGQGPDPRDHLRYTKNGKVEPASADSRVDGDIAALNLNARNLVRGREAVLELVWRRLERAGFKVGELRRLLKAHEVVHGVSAPEYAEVVRDHLLKKLRGRGRAP